MGGTFLSADAWFCSFHQILHALTGAAYGLAFTYGMMGLSAPTFFVSVLLFFNLVNIVFVQLKIQRGSRKVSFTFAELKTHRMLVA
ncbi:hypothetical protein AJ81_10085 [Pseudothermotoga hypogea DSM 11164 = NBRC 106472]|uniref:Uncharacterized protein n=1 Tax=Pseudothermotoga hypogea DSM 11164 = NBRC 106472 TaxID=1123384 RepID=A0A0X1KUK5_9THEM|nr:hypothetical protein AJ81_10085 [Pseudothermotoga hypogea DSM 11164 = NBRC 106472]